MSLRNPIAYIAFLLYCFLVLYTPTQFYWRDSGEFSICAYFLDIAHPAGFPLYSQLANIFSFVPFSPIIFRINAFSLILSLANLLLIYLLAYQILGREFGLQRSTRQLCSAIPCLILLLAPTYLKQSFFPEVYILNALIINILLLLFYEFQSTKDYRYLLICAFVAGLGLGNHVSLGLVILPIIILLLFSRQIKPQIFIVGTLLGCAGLLIYLYLPTRAFQNPPLNTGNPNSLYRMWQLVSDQRDRELRTPAISIETPSEDASVSLWHDICADIKTLTKDINAILLTLALAGLGFLGTSNIFLAIVLITTCIANWFFFMGWDAGPWIPMLSYLALGVAFFIAYLKLNRLCVSAIFVALIILGWRNLLNNLEQIKNFNSASILNKKSLDKLAQNSIFLTEISWFGLKHVQAIDGYRPDLTLIYQPRLLYPDLFEEFHLTDEQGKTFSNLNMPAGLGSFMMYAREFNFEAHPLTNTKLSGIALLNQDGTLSVKKNVNLTINPNYITERLEYYHQFLDNLAEQHGQILMESRLELEARLNSELDLLVKVSRKDLAIKLLSNICLLRPKTLCTPIMLNNLAVYLLNTSAYEQAKQAILLAQSLDEGGLKVRETLKQNLDLIAKTESQQSQ